MWQNGSTERIDVENSNPGKVDGNIHYHDKIIRSIIMILTLEHLKAYQNQL